MGLLSSPAPNQNILLSTSWESDLRTASSPEQEAASKVIIIIIIIINPLRECGRGEYADVLQEFELLAQQIPTRRNLRTAPQQQQEQKKYV
jgi:hypothetical protein